MVRPAWAWVAWEARRAKVPPGPERDVREARSDAHLLLYVARERLRRGNVPLDLVARLEEAAQDPRLTTRRRLQAAEVLARIRVVACGAMRAHRTAREAPDGVGARRRAT